MEKNIDKKMREYKRALSVELAGLLGLGVCAGGFAVTGGLGGIAAVATELSMNVIASRVVDTDEYQAYIRAQREALGAKLDAGEITYEEYHEQYKKMTDKYAVCEYSKTANDEELSTNVENYKISQDFYRTMLGKGAGSFGAGTLASLGLALGAGKTRRKYEDELGIETTEEEPEMAD